MFNYIKYNNVYLTYVLNKTYWGVKNFIVKNFTSEDYNKFAKKQKECIWCKRTHIKNSYFCSKRCEKCYNKEKYQSFKHNNRCKEHKNEILTYKNKCWSCYRDDFIDKIDYPKIKNKFWLRLHGFVLVPTFRTSKDSWNGDKIAFEQNLKDMNVKWFVYIKFYQNTRSNKIKPLVVGKSGSYFVNETGSDLKFSTDINDGPARHFISLNNFQWHYDHIMIKKCRNEKHAYALETKIMNKLDIFGS